MYNIFFFSLTKSQQKWNVCACRFWVLQCCCIFRMPIKSACCQVIIFKLKERWWRKKSEWEKPLLVNHRQVNSKLNFNFVCIRAPCNMSWTSEQVKKTRSVSRMFNFQIYDYGAWIQYLVCCLQTSNSLWPSLFGDYPLKITHTHEIDNTEERNSNGFDSFLLSSTTVHKNSFTMWTQV